MDSFFDFIVSYANMAWDYIVEFFQVVIIPILVEWFGEVVDYFRQMCLQKGLQVPFIMSTENSVHNPFANLISDELKGEGIIEGVFNNKTNQIENLRYVGGNGVDDKIGNILNNNPITILN